MISLPTNFIDNLQAVMSNIFTDLLPLVLFIGGILIGLYVIGGVLNRDNSNKNN